MSQRSPRKPMATAHVSSEHEVVCALKHGLRALSKITSAYYLELENGINVWVGLEDDDRPARRAVYDFEEKISQEFPDVVFDFHVVAVPVGHKIEEYISSARPIFQRSA